MESVVLLAVVTPVLLLGVRAGPAVRGVRRRHDLRRLARARGWAWAGTAAVGLPDVLLGPAPDAQVDDVVHGRVVGLPLVALTRRERVRRSARRPGTAVLALHLGDGVAAVTGLRVVVEGPDAAPQVAGDVALAGALLADARLDRLVRLAPVELRLEGGWLSLGSPGDADPADLLARASLLASAVQALPVRVWRERGVREGDVPRTVGTAAAAPGTATSVPGAACPVLRPVG